MDKHMRALTRSLIGGFALAWVSAPAPAAVVVLNFEGINATYPTTNYAEILNFYNGGTSNQGTSGTNYGISFGSNALAICLNAIGNTSGCSNTSRGGQGDPTSAQGGLFFLSGAETFLDDPAGFNTGFSFFYSAINQGGTIGVFDGLDGTGNQLASLTLPTTPSNCGPQYNAGFCPFVAAGVAFSGTAKSISFGGVANQVVFDDVTFGSSTPTPPPTGVPEPTSLALLGAGIAGLGLFRQRNKSRG